MFCGQSTAPAISIVTGTLNRRNYLQNMVASARAAVYPLSYEFVIVDGGSTDETEAWMEEQRDVVSVLHRARYGAVYAFNDGFKKSRGMYIASLNDDCLIYGDVFCKAVEMMEQDKDIGQVAIPFRTSDKPSPTFDIVPHAKTKQQWLYANFGVTRNWLGNKLGWWGGYDHYSGDAELSLKIWDAGYKVVKLDGNGHILHLEVQDSTRKGNNDSEKFYAKWN